MKEMCSKHPKANTQVFVEDTSLFASGADEEQVADILVPSMIDFGRKVENIKLKLSPKAVIVTNKTKFTARLINELKCMV